MEENSSSAIMQTYELCHGGTKSIFNKSQREGVKTALRRIPHQTERTKKAQRVRIITTVKIAPKEVSSRKDIHENELNSKLAKFPIFKLIFFQSKKHK